VGKTICLFCRRRSSAERSTPVLVLCAGYVRCENTTINNENHPAARNTFSFLIPHFLFLISSLQQKNMLPSLVNKIYLFGATAGKALRYDAPQRSRHCVSFLDIIALNTITKIHSFF